jgi:hypothetical protein
VFACHHPLVDFDGPVADGVRRGKAAALVLIDAGVDLILTGHVHTPTARALPYGDGRSYIAGAGTLSRRTRGVPASFSVIEAGDEAVAITAYAWTGAGFEPLHDWGFPRRAPAAVPVSEAVS